MFGGWSQRAKSRAELDSEEMEGRTAQRIHIDRLAKRPFVIAPAYREHRGRYSGLSDAERELRVPMAPTSTFKQPRKTGQEEESKGDKLGLIYQTPAV